MLRKIKNFSDNGQWRMSYAYKTDLTKGVLQWDSHINRKNSMGHYIFARILFSWITSFFVFFSASYVWVLSYYPLKQFLIVLLAFIIFLIRRNKLYAKILCSTVTDRHRWMNWMSRVRPAVAEISVFRQHPFIE